MAPMPGARSAIPLCVDYPGADRARVELELFKAASGRARNGAPQKRANFAGEGHVARNGTQGDFAHV